MRCPLPNSRLPSLHSSLPRSLLRLAMPCLLAAPIAMAHAAATNIRISEADISRAGIAVTPALAKLDASAGVGNGARFSGTVVVPASALNLISSELGGVVQAVHTATLQQVRAGAPVVTLFSQSYLALQGDYVQKATQAQLAADKLARDNSLFNDGIIARARLDDSRALARMSAVAADERRLALRRAGLSTAQISAIARGGSLSPILVVRAPVAGGILELPVQPGQQIDAGAPIAKLNRAAPLWVELQAARQQPLLKIGDRLQVANCSQLRVIAISPVVNGASQSLQIRAEQLDRDPCLKVNAYVEARLLVPESDAGAVAVPEAALIQRGTERFVFVRNTGGFRIVSVQSRAAGGGMVWVRGALTAGDAVASRGLVALKGAWAGLGSAGVADAPAAGAR